jgi:tRNA 2-thiocytidine biosynthesis protein TtcA
MTVQIPTALPPFTKLGKSIESATRKALYDFEMLKNVKNLAIALSGGKDSLTLLFMLNAINGLGFPKINLYAIHVAGKYSCGAGVDQNFLRAICKQLNITFIVKNAKQQTTKLNCYSCSRQRRKILFDAAKDVKAHTIAFGHHRDDSIQTLLMNLFHNGYNFEKFRKHFSKY